MHTAQDWERQTTDSVASRGGSRIVLTVQEAVTPFSSRCFSGALANVRLASKRSIAGREEERFNVKLGRGGIREIEFIAQALQLAHGGRDDWLRVPHTLVSLGRLADRGFITQQEHSQLPTLTTSCAARAPLTDGARLANAHGPASEKRSLVARAGFASSRNLPGFEDAHAHVRNTYDRLFAKSKKQLSKDELRQSYRQDAALATRLPRASSRTHGATWPESSRWRTYLFARGNHSTRIALAPAFAHRASLEKQTSAS
jgi:hypothetical protein